MTSKRLQIIYTFSDDLFSHRWTPKWVKVFMPGRTITKCCCTSRRGSCCISKLSRNLLLNTSLYKYVEKWLLTQFAQMAVLFKCSYILLVVTVHGINDFITYRRINTYIFRIQIFVNRKLIDCILFYKC